MDVIALRQRGERWCEQIDGVHVYRLPVSHRRGIGFLWTLYEYIAFTVLASLLAAFLAFRKRYSAFVVHNPPDFLLLAGLLPKRIGSRLILDVQDRSLDMFEMRFGALQGARLIERTLIGIERRALHVADAVVTVHEPYRRELIQAGAPATSTFVVMNAVDERLLPAAHRRNEAIVRIVYHGSLTPPYGVGLLIRAAARLGGDVPPWRIEIYGDGDCLQALLDETDRLGLSGRVYFSGSYLHHRHVLECIVGASVGVIPNIDTKLNRCALPTKLFEYVALRIPVIAAALPTICEYFDATELFCFEPGNEDELAAALAEVVCDPLAAAARAECAFRRNTNYRWPANAARYRAVLEVPARD